MEAEKNAPDKIRVLRLRVPCLIGIHEYERKNKQDIIADITLFADLRKSCQSDNIYDTVDYNRIEANMIRFIRESRFFLVEKLADGLARICFDESLVEQVIIGVEKPGAPVLAEAISVEINRKRSDYE